MTTTSSQSNTGSSPLLDQTHYRLPLGYRDNPGAGAIETDPVFFPYIRQMWKLLLPGPLLRVIGQRASKESGGGQAILSDQGQTRPLNEPPSGNTALWREQCEAARRLKAGLGSKIAIQYILGEKLPRFLLAADRDPALVPEVPQFIAEVSTIFNRAEIRQHLPGVRYIRAAAQVESKEAAVLLERMKGLLMGRYGATLEKRRAARHINPQ